MPIGECDRAHSYLLAYGSFDSKAAPVDLRRNAFYNDALSALG